MQLHVKDSSGDWYTIDFAFWNNEGGNNGPANHVTLFKLKNTIPQDAINTEEVKDSTKTIYYTNLRKCYTDYAGTTVASNSNTSGYYINIADYRDITASNVWPAGDNLNYWRVFYTYTYHHPTSGDYTYPAVLSAWPVEAYAPVSFDNYGQMIIDTNPNNFIVVTRAREYGGYDYVYYFRGASVTTSIPISSTFTGYKTNSGSGGGDADIPVGGPSRIAGFSSGSNDLYIGTLTRSLTTMSGHFSTGIYSGGTLTVASY